MSFKKLVRSTLKYRQRLAAHALQAVRRELTPIKVDAIAFREDSVAYNRDGTVPTVASKSLTVIPVAVYAFPHSPADKPFDHFVRVNSPRAWNDLSPGSIQVDSSV